MATRLTDAELVELVQQKTPEELSLDEIEQLRTRLHDSPDLQRTLIEQLHLEAYLNTALGETRVSASEIVRRANAATQPKRTWQRWLLWTGLASLVVGIGFVIWQNDNANQQLVQNDPPDDNPPIADGSDSNSLPTESENATNGDNTPTGLESEPIEVMLADSDPNQNPSTAVANANPKPAGNEVATIKINESAPWFDGLNPNAVVETLEDTSTTPPLWVLGESFDKKEAVQWWKAAAGHGLHVEDREVHRIRNTKLEGLAKLQAPWVDGAVLRVGMFDFNQPRFHFWNGTDGVSIRGYFNFNPQSWLAYQATRETGNPQPKTLVLHDCDDGIHNRSEFGPIEFRWQAGELIMSRGNIRMVTVPMAQPPTEVYFEGKAHFSECTMYRGQPLPNEPPPQNPRLVEATRPADWTWLSDQAPDGRNTLHELGQGRPQWAETIAEGVSVEAHADGTVSLAVEKSDKLQTATAFAPGRQFREIICRLEHIEPGTGLTLATDENVVVQRLAIVRDRKTGQLVLLPHQTYQKEVETDLDPNSRFSPYVADGQWLRIVPGFNSIAVYTSRDGVHWGRTNRHPIRSIAQRPTTVGLFVYPTEEPKQIRIGHLEVRALDAISSLASAEVLRRVPDWEWSESPDDSQWHQRVLASRPVDVAHDDWQRACAVQFLRQHDWCALSANLLRSLIDAGLTG